MFIKNKINRMYKDIVDYIGNIALKHIAVKSFKYQKRIMVNQQNNNSYMQFIIEDDTYLQYIKTANVFTATFNIDIIGQPKDDTDILNVQNDALQVGAEVIQYITNDDTYRNLISVYDYDFLAISHFTDDNSAGYRLSLELIIPNPVNLCEYLNNFSEDNIPVEAEKPLDIINSKPDTKSNELVLTPIKLPKNKR